MATWMEKDVLIECISSVLGPTSWTHDADDPDRIALAQQQGRLYGICLLYTTDAADDL